MSSYPIRGRTIAALAAALVAALTCAGCTRPRSAQSIAEQEAAFARTAEQARLWRDAANGNLAPGLDRVAVPEHPIQGRPVASVTSQQVPSRSFSLRDDASGVRVVDDPRTPDAWSGPATVVSVNGDRLELDLGNQRFLTTVARAGGKPLPVAVGERVSVEYREREDIRRPSQVVAIRAGRGDGIAHVIESGERPVTINLPLFSLTARQAEPPSRTVTVTVTDNSGAQSSAALTPGQTAQVGGLTVTVQGSVVRDAVSPYREGAPFSVNLLVWRSGP